jgi:hypothetical protein
MSDHDVRFLQFTVKRVLWSLKRADWYFPLVSVVEVVGSPKNPQNSLLKLERTEENLIPMG